HRRILADFKKPSILKIYSEVLVRVFAVEMAVRILEIIDDRVRRDLPDQFTVQAETSTDLDVVPANAPARDISHLIGEVRLNIVVARLDLPRAIYISERKATFHVL